MMKRFNLAALIIVVILVGGFLWMGPSGTQRIQSAFLGFISPFLKTGSALEKKITAVRHGLKTLAQLEVENQQLSVRNKELSAVNSMLRDLEAENRQLRKALEYRERAEFKLVPARIIARDASTWWNTVEIDRGTAEGIRREMPVLTESGLVGKVTVVSDHAATVVLISDESCKVAAKIEGTREQGIVSGERDSGGGVPLISMRIPSKQAELEPGRKVYSSGVGGVYPAGILIGVLRDFKARELDGYATLIPAVDLTTLEDVFVVTGAGSQ
ncbi:MAG TPA: rod shape-determining protein MreC [Chthoniobacteraceae bacterium]|nr:rod shape-determining protein MreC [Chthoniobacteraceae bacterium]